MSCEEKKCALAASANQSMVVTKLMEATARGKPLANAKLYGRLGKLTCLAVCDCLTAPVSESSVGVETTCIW